MVEPVPNHPAPSTDADDAQSSFATLLGEFRAVHRCEPLNAALKPAETEADLRQAAFAIDASALCLSGGGIRSASFCLGVVQGLAKRAVWSKFDYLSTVSGGGYLGSMLAAWAYRAPGGAADVETGLGAREQRDGSPLDMLRRQLRYLAPKKGVFSVDTWTLVSTFVRNFLLNALVWLPAIAVVLLVPIGIAAYIDLVAATVGGTPMLQTIAIASLWVSIGAILYATFELRHAIARDRALPPPAGQQPLQQAMQQVVLPANRRIQEALFFGGLLLAAAAYWLSYADPVGFWNALAHGPENSLIPSLHMPATTPRPVILGTFFAILHGYFGWSYANQQRRPDEAYRLAAGVAGAVCGFVSGALIAVAMTVLVHNGGLDLGLEDYVMLAPPVFLTAVAVGEILFVGAISHFSTDFDREWWSRAGAWSAIFCIGWLGVCGIAFYGPIALHALVQTQFGASAYAIAVALTGVVARVLLRQEAPTARDGQPKPRLRIADRAIDGVATIALAAVLAGIASLATHALGWTNALLEAVGFDLPHVALPFTLLDVALLGAFLAIIVVAAGSVVNVNRFSLHSMYRDRLIRTFLGATRGQYPPPAYPPDDDPPRYTESNQFAPRNPERFIEFDRDDNPILRWLAPDRGQSPLTPRKGPFLIVNAALNLVAGRNLAWQERKAASFTFTPLAVGSPQTGYRGSDEYLRDVGGVTLGTAMAVSGAAVSPNSGALSSPVRTFLLAVCNARLGWWLGHPRDRDAVRKVGPGFALRALLNEILGHTDDRHPWLFVSDGGHFENLGLYEAVRRGCRDIVVVDGSCDPDRNFDDLGNAVRKIRIDLGVRVERAGPLRVGGRELQQEGRYCALFDVIYDETRSGSLLYIKSALYPKSENTPIDVLQYAGRSDTFPHESTARQFFTESQFESYRALGEFEVDAMIEGVEAANRIDITRVDSVAQFVEFASLRMAE